MVGIGPELQILGDMLTKNTAAPRQSINDRRLICKEEGHHKDVPSLFSI